MRSLFKAALCLRFPALLAALGIRQSTWPMFASVPCAASALAMQGLKAMQEPIVDPIASEVFLPEDPVENFSAVIAENARFAEEVSKHLARVRAPVSKSRMPAGPPQQLNLSPPPQITFHKTLPSGGKLFFLFLIRSGMSHIDLWKAFFERASKSHYDVFLYCDDGELDCQSEFLTDNDALGINVVPAVESKYCADVVSAMVQLLRHAQPLSQHPDDKFIFVSESTLPVKPFWQIYLTLASDSESDFCVSGTQGWQYVAAKNQSLRLLKHSQWITLSSTHARIIVERWEEIKGHAEYWRLPMSDSPGKAASMQLAVPVSKQVPECADEFAPFAAIFGAVRDDPETDEIAFEGVRGSPIQLKIPHGQGSCRTFATFGTEAGTETMWIARAINDDAGSMLSCFPCHSYHPAAVGRISDVGLNALRWSSFLFARKFAADALTPDQFRRVILAR